MKAYITTLLDGEIHLTVFQKDLNRLREATKLLELLTDIATSIDISYNTKVLGKYEGLLKITAHFHDVGISKDTLMKLLEYQPNGIGLLLYTKDGREIKIDSTELEEIFNTKELVEYIKELLEKENITGIIILWLNKVFVFE